jgi:hypothetical protein
MLPPGNRSEIQNDLSDGAFKFLASFTQIEKFHRGVDWLKHQIFNGIAKNESSDEVSKLIDKYQIALKKLKGYGISTHTYTQDLPGMYEGLKKLQLSEGKEIE